MKKLTTILQLPIMDILNGKKVGQTKDVIMNQDTKEITFVLQESTVTSLNVIDGKEILRVGRDVILIKTNQAIQNTQENPELAKALGESYSLMGLDVITIEGNMEGEIIDLFIDMEEKKIAKIELAGGRTYDTVSIVSISDKYVFVQGKGSQDALGQDGENLVEANIGGAQISEDQQEANLINMTLTSEVSNENGTFIVRKGTELTEELIRQAKEQGVFTDLIMYAE